MSFEYSTFEISCFINRLRSLQWFCSETDKSSPRALLFIPGPDGRNNPGSVNILKYLFRGSVSKSLFDETLDGPFEALEDIILLIKETSISIIYSKPMKELINPFISRVPHVIEYCYSPEEESDIDKFQQRKCEHFKRMILESLNADDGVGLSVPIGYDDIMDVESWPMLQSFALETVIAPTGFFTNRHNIADISPNLDMLFRTVDGTYVTNALQVTKMTLVPHVQQMLMVMQSAVPSQRKKISADDVIGPLEVMYEFGEIESAGSLEKISPPVVFFGPHTTQIGVLQQALAKSDAWRDHTINHHLHSVVEGCEPSTGMRFCRTYFLKHGTGDVLAKTVREFQRELAVYSSRGAPSAQHQRNQEEDDPDFDFERTMPQNKRYVEEKKQQDVDDDIVPGGDELKLSGDGEDLTSKSFQNMKEDVQRMQTLYTKLWFSLRILAFDTFFSSHDVLDAATSIQRVLNALLCKEEIEDSFPFLQSLPGELRGEEKLQLHIDCMNALGEIISLEDVNDLGGACWVYIRATINDIHLESQREPVAVAVGDTFLFSPLVHAADASLKFLREERLQHSKVKLIPHMTDYCCGTAEIPYFASMNGLGYEEDYSRLIHLMLRNQQLAAPLKLGRAMENQYSSSGQSRFPCLLDHPSLPYFDAEIKSFSSGFVVDRINRGHEIPVVVSFEKHVKQVFITDLADTISLANQRILNTDTEDPTVKEITDTLIGYVITFELHTTSDASNPLSCLFQSSSEGPVSHFFSIVVRLRAGEVGATVLPALDIWKASFRMHDIPVQVGVKVGDALPDDILQAMLCLLDRFACMSRTAGLVFHNHVTATATHSSGNGGNLFSAGTATTLFSGHDLSLDTIDLPDHTAVIDLVREYVSRIGVPGIAHSAMCVLHVIAEVQRLSPFAFEDLMHAVDQQRARPVATLATTSWAFGGHKNAAMDVLVGTPGSGLKIVQSLFKQKLSVYYGAAAVHIEYIDIDFTDLALRRPLSDLTHSHVVDFLETHMQGITRTLQDFNSDKRNNINKKLVFFITITMSPLVHVKCCDLWVCLSCVTGVRIVNVTAVVSPDVFLPQQDQVGLGAEGWRALTTQSLRPSSANAVLLLDSSTQTPAWRQMKDLLAQCNPSAHLLRVHPNIPSLAVQDWEYYATRLEAHFQQVNALKTTVRHQENERESFMMALGFPSPEQMPFLGRDLRHLDFKTLFFPAHPPLPRYMRCLEYRTQEEDVWALTSVLSLLTLLFPQAKTTTYSLTPHWQAAALSLAETPAGSFQRLVQLASAKVLTQQHAQQLSKRFQQDVASLTQQTATKKSDVVPSLRRGILSVVVVMTLKGETLTLGTASSQNPKQQQQQLSQDTEQCVLIEANRSFISLREYAGGEVSRPAAVSRMWVHGVFDEAQVSPASAKTAGVLSDLVQACKRHRMRRVASMVPEDVTETQRMRIQRLSHFRERVLPTGWWFDGHHFINFHGVNRLLRPDIDEIVQEYCVAKNVEIAKHNRLMDALHL